MNYNGISECVIRCWCFDCGKIFLVNGESAIGESGCSYCRKKNYDFDTNFRYSARRKNKKNYLTVKLM